MRSTKAELDELLARIAVPDEQRLKADCHDECVPLAEEVRRLESLCEVKRLELKDLREELAEAHAAHTAKTLSLKANERKLPLFDLTPLDDAPPDDLPDSGRVEEPSEPDWLDTPLEDIFDCEATGIARAVEFLAGCDVRTAKNFLDRKINYPGTWHHGVGQVGGRGVGAKTAKAMDEVFDAWVAGHEKAEGGTDA